MFELILKHYLHELQYRSKSHQNIVQDTFAPIMTTTLLARICLRGRPETNIYQTDMYQIGTTRHVIQNFITNVTTQANDTIGDNTHTGTTNGNVNQADQYKIEGQNRLQQLLFIQVLLLFLLTIFCFNSGK